MDSKKLLADAAIIIVILTAGMLIYLAFPKKTDEVVPKTQDTLTSSTTKENMQENSQLKVEVIKEGSGGVTKSGDTISVHYTGMLMDGTVFDSSLKRGVPFELTLGRGQVIAGWELGLQNMKVGENRKLTIPPELAYGADGFPGVIPPSATLIFEVELVSIK